MKKITRQINKNPTYIFLFGVIIVSLCCIGITIKFKYFPIFPISPPPTDYGDNIYFDSILKNANNRWLFLFQKDTKVITTDIFGEEQSTIFDLKVITQNDGAQFQDRYSINPSNNYLAVNYNVFSTTGKRIEKFIVYNLLNGESFNISPELPGYEFDRLSPAYWLGENILVKKMHRYTSGAGANSEEIVFIRYDLNDLSNLQKFELIPGPHTIFYKYDSNVLIFSNHLQSNPPIYAIDINGFRLATENEIKHAKIYNDDCHRNTYYPDCYLHTMYEFPIVKTERVKDTIGFDPLGKSIKNKNRYFIYLDDVIVRITDIWIEQYPLWDSELELFIWKVGDSPETEAIYYMDALGHYHLWFHGIYINKIPLN